MTTREDGAAAYVAVRERMTELVRPTSSEELARQVPACPDWSVQDLLAHAVGVAVDVAARRIEGAGSDPWTAAQVRAPYRTGERPARRGRRRPGDRRDC